MSFVHDDNYLLVPEVSRASVHSDLRPLEFPARRRRHSGEQQFVLCPYLAVQMRHVDNHPRGLSHCDSPHLQIIAIRYC
jgi:hypothetical protein